VVSPVTEVIDGFPFDRAGHFLHISSAAFRTAVAESGVPLREHRRRACIMLGGRQIPYPLQFNLWNAPESLRGRVLDELRRRPEVDPPRKGNLGEYLLDVWGEALFEAFFRPFNEKLWRRPLGELPADCLGRYLPPPNPELVVRGASRSTDQYGYNSSFFYPAAGRIGDLAAGLAMPFRNRIYFNTEVVGVDLDKRLCCTNRGTISFDSLIWTGPLPKLLVLSRLDPTPFDFEDASIAVLGLGIEGAAPASHHWVYVPDPEIPFHRVNFTAAVGARGKSPLSQSVLVEFGLGRSQTVLEDPGAAAEQALQWLIGNDLLQPSTLSTTHLMKLQPAYVIRRRDGSDVLRSLEDRLLRSGVRVAGRYGTWDYLSMEESFLSGSKAADIAVEDPLASET